MMGEELRNVRPGWVIGGWLVAVAVASLIAVALIGLGLLGGDEVSDALWSAVAIAIGFWVGGFFTGIRAQEAPILHGIGIGLSSLVAWFVVNAAVGLLFGRTFWEGLSVTLTLALLVEQLVVATAGAWVGRRIAARGGTELIE